MRRSGWVGPEKVRKRQVARGERREVFPSFSCVIAKRSDWVTNVPGVW